SGSVSGTATVTVTNGDFTLSIAPASRSVHRGGSATYTVSVSPLGGFSGSVTLSLSRQPSGSAVTFSAHRPAGTSTLTITASSSAARRSYGLTITGISGSLSRTTTATLTVTR